MPEPVEGMPNKEGIDAAFLEALEQIDVIRQEINKLSSKPILTRTDFTELNRLTFVLQTLIGLAVQAFEPQTPKTLLEDLNFVFPGEEAGLSEEEE